MMKPLIVAALLMTGATPVLAQAAANQIAVRHKAYEGMGDAFKKISDELRNSTPNNAILQASVKTIDDMARRQYSLFPAGSGPESGVKTLAKAEIWAQPAKFKAAQDKFAAEAASFSKLVAAGDAAKIRDGAKSLGQACKACHTDFRAEKK